MHPSVLALKFTMDQLFNKLIDRIGESRPDSSLQQARRRCDELERTKETMEQEILSINHTLLQFSREQYAMLQSVRGELSDKARAIEQTSHEQEQSLAQQISSSNQLVSELKAKFDFRGSSY
jgi:septal ring factor EnvC (AmiA/AmiB activator)